MVDEIISYRDMCSRLKINAIQNGMNYHLKKDLSVILMSIRENAPYEDEIDEKTNLLIYEGHDTPKTDNFINPKEVDQPMNTEKGTLTENGKFYDAAQRYKNGLSTPEKVAVFEKLRRGIWCDKGIFELVDAKIVEIKGRNVFKFYLKPTGKQTRITDQDECNENVRMISSQVMLEVWKRDKGKCVFCGSKKNLHFDHIIP